MPHLQYVRPSGISFANEAESLYFDLFRKELVPALSGALTSTIWETIILQACHAESFVRECVIALAALKKSLTSSKSDSACAGHYAFALRQYDKAIQNMSKALTKDILPLRNALIGCLLVFCFEGFQGNQDLAISHAQSGYQLLQDWLAKASSQSTSIYGKGISSPAPLVIEDDLVHVFKRLDLQIMTVSDSRSTAVHLLGKTEGSELIHLMPSSFSDLKQAHRYWELVMRRSAHFIHYAAPLVGAGEGPVANAVTLGSFRRTSTSPTKTTLPKDFSAEQSRYASENLRWQAAVRHLLLSPDSTIRAGAMFLKCLSVATELVFASLLIKNECEYDCYLPRFQEIVALARSLSINSPGQERHGAFSIDFGIVPALFIAVKSCRDRVVRREALGILRSCPRREGVWDGLLMAGIGEWIIGVEEEGSEGEFVPECARVKLTKVKVEISTKTAALECAKRGDAKEEEVMLQTTIKWG
jgi:hypothetical protein